MEIAVAKLIRSRRRTLALEISANAELIVRAPLSTSQEYIKKFILQKSAWIRKKQQLINDFRKQHPVTEYVDGAKILYLGETYQLKVIDDAEIFFADALFFPKRFLNKAPMHLLHWYKKQALEVISARVAFYAKQIGVQYTAVKISSANKRWGSCSQKGSLNFSWRLIKAPEMVIDYVVVHELVHLWVKNHSRKFWYEVAKIFPLYKTARRYLKDNSRRLLV